MKPTDSTPDAIKYTVIFETLGGTSVESVVVEAGNKIPESILPTEEGNYWHYVDGEPAVW